MMHVARWSATGALALTVALVGCAREDDSVAEKLDRIDSRMAKMEKQLASIAVGGARAAGKARKARPRPKPEKTYSVPVAGAPVTGKPDALVTIVEGFEFACGWCEKSRGMVAEVLKDYPDDVRLVHKNYVVHPEVASVPARAGCAANNQGAFGRMEPLIWDKGFKQRKLDRESMISFAKEAGLDVATFTKDMDGAACAAQVKRDQAELARVGVSGTPAFFINGRWLNRRSVADFKALIDEELALARKRVADGTKKSDYYAEWVVAKGQKKL